MNENLNTDFLIGTHTFQIKRMGRIFVVWSIVRKIVPTLQNKVDAIEMEKRKMNENPPKRKRGAKRLNVHYV